MTTTTKKHIGRNIAKIREIKGIKQEALADLMGVSQQKISQYENTEEIEDAKLEPIAKALGVTSEAIKNFSEENVINYFNTFHDNVVTTGSIFASNCTFNPLDKLIEAYEDNKKVYQEKEVLHERLLQAEKDKVAYLEKLLNKN
jgi:transcriptional regulator with XRE-family HTH domain